MNAFQELINEDWVTVINAAFHQHQTEMGTTVSKGTSAMNAETLTAEEQRGVSFARALVDAGFRPLVWPAACGVIAWPNEAPASTSYWRYQAKTGYWAPVNRRRAAFLAGVASVLEGPT